MPALDFPLAVVQLSAASSAGDFGAAGGK